MRNIMILAMILLAACEREAPQPTDPLDLLPPATQTGENTLGFLLDGEPWTPNRLFQGDYRKSDGRFGITCEYADFDDDGNNIGYSFSIGSVSVPVFSSELYQITNRGNLSSSLVKFRHCWYWSSSTFPGTLHITRLDTIERVMSGTFEVMLIGEDCIDTLSITHGRFDVSF